MITKEICPLCKTKLDTPIGDLYSIKCPQGHYTKQVYHYGYDIIITENEEIQWFSFDDCGMGWKEEETKLKKAIKDWKKGIKNERI